LSSLADRIRGIVSGAHATALHQPGAVTPGSKGPGLHQGLSDPPDGDGRGVEATLGGAWRDACFVVDRRLSPSAVYGRARIGELAERLERASGNAPLFTGGAPARPPFVFFDLETTGLNGGAGTQAFLVGCAWFEADGSFTTRQLLLTRYTDERALLETVSSELARAGALVSFNGKSFDAPVLETRYLFHRLPWNGRQLPHIDLLHPARRFWNRRSDGARAFPPSRNASADHRSLGGGGQASDGCSLVALEKQILGVRRMGDVAGFEIPGRYFQFVRSGDARPLVAILEHNRRDLLTLAALTARLLHVTHAGPDAAHDAREALALGHVYARGGFDERAQAAYRHAIDRCRSPRGAYDPARIEALRSLALAWRRARRHGEAAACWSELLEIRGCPLPIAREATEALAIHHEHRERDLGAAKAFALRSLEHGLRPAWTQAARHRLARIERKMTASGRSASLNLE
jgi:uncharacterized protein YprB with RNaseH-like and TPR domain